jgi:phosphatidylinositol alpha-1,6-mannosyltransferase
MNVVFSQVFPPENGGSGRWLFEAYSRFPIQSFVMLVGLSEKSTNADADYPQFILRKNLFIGDRSFFSFRSFLGYCRVLRVLHETIKKHGAKEVHASRPLHEGLTTAILKLVRRFRFVLFVHGEDVNIATTSRKLRWSTAFTLARSDLIITNSHFSKNLLLTDWKVPESKIRVVHPGVDIHFFTPGPKTRKHSPFTILTVGRLQKRKGHDILIRAMAEIVSINSEIQYRIAGSGEERSTLDILVAKHGLEKNVVFLGEISDLELLDEYRNCDLFVLPNRANGKDIEGFGMVLLEAQACGKPVIAGASGGTTEAVSDQESGFVLPCEGTELLVNEVLSIMSDAELRKEMGLKARSFASSNFSWDRCAELLHSAVSH